MSSPGSKPAFWMASTMTSTASSLERRLGAKPPSSPMLVLYPRPVRTFFRL